MQGRRILENSLPEVHFDNKELIHINWKGYWFTVVNISMVGMIHEHMANNHIKFGVLQSFYYVRRNNSERNGVFKTIRSANC